MRMVTLKDLAAELNLSVPTVSLALRNAGNISPETCARVQAAARRLGYRPNVYAAALSTAYLRRDAHQMPVAIVRCREADALDPAQPLVHALRLALRDFGYQLEDCPIDSPGALEKELVHLYHRGVQGLFVGTLGRELEAAARACAPFSIVQCGRLAQPSGFHSVRSDVFESARFLFGQAMRRGYRRLGGIFPAQAEALLDAEEGLGAQACLQRRADDRAAARVLFAAEEKDAYKVASWVRREKLDAVIAGSPGWLEVLARAGLRVPEKLGFATLAWAPEAARERISGMRERHVELAGAAAHVMDLLIRRHERGVPKVAQAIVIGRQWVEGRTLPFKNASAGRPQAKAGRAKAARDRARVSTAGTSSSGR